MDFTSQFPILNNCTYLNTAYAGLLSTELAAWRRNHDQQFVEMGSNFRLEHHLVLDETRKEVAQLFGSDLANTYLVQNFSIGFTTLLNGLDKTHRFLLLKEDYPSVNYPIKSSGFAFTEVSIDEQLEEQLLSRIKEFKPTVFAFSIVQYISGIRISPSFIKKLKTDFPDLLIVGDATQFMGTTVFDFNTSGFDAVLGSGYKWLMAGFGNGYALLSNQMKEELFNQKKNGYLPDSPFLAGKDHFLLTFEPGHQDTLNFGSLNQSLKYINSIGLQAISDAAKKISDQARLALHQRGLISNSLYTREFQSTIISLALSTGTVSRLEEAKILCSARGAGTRFSFHFYNTENDLDKLLEVIDK
ncbi:aminotransferase class V-fold PLP-dependent enzyme [Pedobacter sp. BMA]|uniref:aminotransferase class V-fold PLP-dependent enzyme n=1 Tax=Pedobacter sp. BMA TaxID=1663685 RepID=UPI0006493DC1|nr:aminotransferase class V-fold PLP-dependent enzyme [Pedobacter sp. BMA]KLT65401.1 hypothetical protein AB669_09945 [Pedobacter sp. BMA]